VPITATLAISMAVAAVGTIGLASTVAAIGIGWTRRWRARLRWIRGIRGIWRIRGIGRKRRKRRKRCERGRGRLLAVRPRCVGIVVLAH
jgi:hypothetical protein